jgi:hypothetical protein
LIPIIGASTIAPSLFGRLEGAAIDLCAGTGWKQEPFVARRIVR